jgi:hypothetical protein
MVIRAEDSGIISCTEKVRLHLVARIMNIKGKWTRNYQNNQRIVRRYQKTKDDYLRQIYKNWILGVRKKYVYQLNTEN